ncbi:MAG: TrkH family potassium uptake protein, partial [Ruminiclostridium sp.]|nr:TrkH family potassium uptake protein [Ruminiclostridium sp.]
LPILFETVAAIGTVGLSTGITADLTLYSRLALSATGVLLLLGWVYFTWAEWANPATLGALAPADRVVGGLFQSVNLRTAGFALFDQGGMTEAAQAVSLLFMVIGGCSGSTACGIKVVTALVLAAALWAGLRGRPETVIAGRTIPREQVRNAMTLTFVVVLAAFLAAVVLAHVEGMAFLPILFETVAAIGTVGLSTGITADLTLFSQSVLLVLMFLGRAGVLALSLGFLIRRPAETRIGYPTCDLFIG